MTTDHEGPEVPDRRWPRWVYGTGDEPDYRFSLANERTLLAWLRTALALLAAGVAVDQVDLAGGATLQAVLATVLVRAIRRREPLPTAGVGLLLTLGVVAVGVLVLVLL